MALFALAWSVATSGARADQATAVEPLVDRCRVCDLGDPYFESVGDAESIPDNNITALAQDQAGFLWIGTPSGLVRYDGYRFRRFDLQPGSDGAVRGVFIRVLLVASDGRLWIGTDADGLWVFDPGLEQFEAFRHDPTKPQSINHDNIRALAEDAAGGIWIGTRQGLNYWQTGAGMRNFPQRLGADTLELDDRILALLVDPEQTLWVGAWNGLSRLEVGDSQFERVEGQSTDPARHSGPLSSIQILSLSRLSDGQISIGTAQSGGFLLSADSRLLRQVPTGDDSAVGIASYSLVMLEASAGELWMGGFGGIQVLDIQTGQMLQQMQPDPSIRSSLAHSQVRAMLRDRAGQVWIGGYGGGLQRHDPSNQSIRVLHHSPNRGNSLTASSVSAVLELSDGQIWVGTRENGIDQLDRKRGIIGGFRADPDDPTALGHPMILSMAQTNDGSVWVGTLADLHRFDPQSRQFKRYATAQGLSGNTARRLLAGPQGELWIGSNAGLMRWTPAVDRIHSVPDSDGERASTDINALTLDNDKRLWVGAASGLYTVSPGTLTMMPVFGESASDRDLLNATVVGLLMDRSGRIWVDTNNGLLRVRRHGPLTSHPQQGLAWQVALERVALLPGQPVEPFGANLLEDRLGRIWSHHHVYDPDSDSLNELTRADGADLGTGWYRSYTATHDGLLLFGGSNGLMLVDPDRYQPWAFRPAVVISEIKVDGELIAPRDYASGLHLPATARGFQLEFAALDYSAPSRNRYSYRLQGYDLRWVESDASRRLATYNNLWPGSYQLEIAGSNRVGQFGAEPLRLAVQVAPQYWQTPWFVALLLAALAMLIAAGMRWQTARLRRQQHELELQVHLRTSELSLAKERAETAFDQLQSAQKQLVVTEKLASLGQLVAGVAHEINTPLGTALTAASLLHDETDVLRRRHQDQSLRRNDLSQYLELADSAQHLVDSNLTRAAQLVRSFKQISADSSSDERRHFDLAERLQAMVESLQLSWRSRPMELILECAPGLSLDSYPGTLGQIINSFTQNALLHAFDADVRGRIVLSASAIDNEQVLISFSDDGRGIAENDLPRVFEPFFTTQRARGCIGLGLHTVFNLVNARLGGSVSVSSQLGRGTRFIVQIPKVAPA